LLARLRAGLGFELAEARPIDPGVIHNNRLTRLVGADGRELVLKTYFRDDRRRLEREFGAFAFLRGGGFAGVPVAHLRDDEHYCAVYSFERGRTKSPAELSLDELAAIGRLAAELHRFRPDAAGADLPPAFPARSWADRVGFLRRRLAVCLSAAAAPDADEPLRAVVAELDLSAALERLIAGATAGLPGAELVEPAPDEHTRFNTGDFAPHNILVRPDGSLCAIDFEYFGPEEAAALPVSFLAAEQSLGLTAAQTGAFLRAYHAARDVPDAAFARYERLRALFELSWVLVNLSLMTPAHVARKRFAGDFDLDAHLAERAARLRQRLAGAERLVGALAGA
jgi:hypothetical protein